MSTYILETGTKIEFDDRLVLSPDIVTECLAKDMVELLNEKHHECPIDLIELGIGTGAFSRRVLDSIDQTTNICGLDIDQNAIDTVRKNLASHSKLGRLALIKADYTKYELVTSTFDAIYFNPPYLKPGTQLHDDFKNAPEPSVYAENIKSTYELLLPRIAISLKLGGIAIIRYPGDGSATYAGEDAKASNASPFVSSEEINRCAERLFNMNDWFSEHMPPGIQSYMIRNYVNDRRVNSELICKVGSNINNSPKSMQDMDEYWQAMSQIYNEIS